MKTIKTIIFTAVCLISFAAFAAAQTGSAASELGMKSKELPRNVSVYSIEFDVSTNGENAGLSGKSIFKNALIMTSNTFRSKLAQFVKSGEVTNVNKHFLSVVDGAAGEVSSGRQLPVIKSGGASSENEIEFINAGYLLKASPVVVHTATNPIPDAVSLALEIADNEVDMPLQFEDGIPVVIEREIKINELFYSGNTRIFGGFLSKDGKTRRFFAVAVEVASRAYQKQ